MPRISDPTKKKTHVVAVKYSATEFDKLEKEANRTKMTVTAMVRAGADEIVGRKVTVRIGRNFETMSLLDARELLKDLAAKVY